MITSTAEFDKAILEKSRTTGYDLRELVKGLTNSQLKDYEAKFKQENNIPNELTNDDIKLLSNVGHVVLEEKLNRDRKKVFGNTELWG
jgi:hypothetical protein